MVLRLIVRMYSFIVILPVLRVYIVCTLLYGFPLFCAAWCVYVGGVPIVFSLKRRRQQINWRHALYCTRQEIMSWPTK